MKIKYLWVMIIIFLSINDLSVRGLEVPEPYMVSENIPNQRIEKDACLVILSQNSQLEETEVTVQEKIELIEAEIEKVTGDYELVNQAIIQLESAENDSLTFANQSLEDVVEEVYQYYFDHDPEFPELSLEEQEIIVTSDETVIAWLDYIKQIETLIQDKVIQRDNLEAYYLNLHYDLETLSNQKVNQIQSGEDYNQCLLYPYSVKNKSVDDVLLNDQLSLNDYLVQVDKYLQSLIPIAYHKVKYDDIYQRFSREISQEELEASYLTKQPIEIDPRSLEQYSYAKELNLNDIQTIVEFAQYKRNSHQNQEAYHELYQEIIELKESQWHYIYQINEVAIENLKHKLATYLNHHQAFDEGDIDLVRGLHNRYQVRLVYFNDSDQSWSASQGMDSGFLDEYIQKEFTSDRIETTEEPLHTQVDNHKNNYQGDIKDKFIRNMESKARKGLPDIKAPSQKPNTPPEITNPPEITSQEESRESGQVKLPSTGEQRPYTILALTLLIAGLATMFYNFLQRYRTRKKIEEIELD